MRGEGTIRFLLGCGAAGTIFFVVAFLIEGATRPGYDAWRTFVSLLSLGDGGWLQVLNFLVSGALIMAFAVGLRRALVGRGSTWGPLFVGTLGAGMVLAGIFSARPGQGYPPGSPERLLDSPSLSSTIHGIAALVAFLAIPAACLVLARRFATESGAAFWVPYAVASGVIELTLFFASALAPDQPSLRPIAGLLQRGSIIVGFAWIAMVAVRELRMRSLPAAPA